MRGGRPRARTASCHRFRAKLFSVVRRVPVLNLSRKFVNINTMEVRHADNNILPPDQVAENGFNLLQLDPFQEIVKQDSTSPYTAAEKK
ncbi:unnamed protein product, partial [Brenthis ino]